MTHKFYAASESAQVTTLETPAIVVVCFAGLAALYYFPWRLTTFNPQALLLSAALLGAELFGLVTVLLHAFMTWRMVVRTPPDPVPGLSVDVFIPTYNEPVEMLRRTLIAAREMTYPHITWLLDDGNRPEMAALAAELGVRYLAREDNLNAKAGNLNHALANSSGDVIAIFDADHVPHQSYLSRTLGYFSDPNVAFVQTPQDFYNLDSFQHRHQKRHNLVWSEQSLFFRVIMPGKDYWNAAFFCGSCATVRRSALESIDGFATDTITEDLHTSLRLHKKGYGSVYHAESLAFGIAPDTFEPYESQRVRWGQGAMQVWRKEAILTTHGLTMPQRLCYFASVLTYFDGWQKAFMYLLPSFVLVTGFLPVAALNWHYVAMFVPWYLLSLWATEELGRGYARSWTIEEYNFLRYPGFAFATLTFFLNRKLRFRVTKKDGSNRGDNIRRMAPHLAIIGISISSILVGLIRFVLSHYMQTSAFVFNLIWIGVVLFISVTAIRFVFSHIKQERGSYRFRLPVPIIVHHPQIDEDLLITEDVSSGGLRVQLSNTTMLAVGTVLDVDLVLPQGRKKVGAKIRRRCVNPEIGGRWHQDLALEFEWPSRADADNLDRYLYGSNAEWLFRGLDDRGQTPISWISNDFRHSAAKPHNLGDEWQPAIIIPSDHSGSLVVMAASRGSEADTVLSEKPIIWRGVTLISTLGQQHIGRYRIISVEPYKVAGMMLFKHALEPFDAQDKRGDSRDMASSASMRLVRP